MQYEITSVLRGIKRGWIEVDGERVNGKVCIKCEIMKPITEYTPSKHLYDGHINKCKPCRAHDRGVYAKENREITRKAERKWREANPEKVKEMARRSRERNAEGYRRRLKEWREQNPERDRELKRNYALRHPERVYETNRKWRKANPEKLKAYSANRRARVRDLPYNFDDEWADVLLNLYGGCILTGEREDIHWDHFIPISSGKGGTTFGNMVPLKSTINKRKSDKNPIDFLIDEGMSDKSLYGVLYTLATFNQMEVSEYIRYVYECFEGKEAN